jgi:hypothetical protein
MWYSIIRGKGTYCSTVGRSLEGSLNSNMRCRAVCSVSSGQVQCGVGTFPILWRYERKQLWFVSSCVRKWFGQRERVLDTCIGCSWMCFV